MSFNIGVMNAAVTLDDSDFQNKLSGLENKADSSFKKIANMAAAYLSFRVLGSFVKTTVKSFSDLENAAWNFDQVFKDIPATAAQAEQEMRTLYKLSETTSKEMLSTAANQLQAFGFSVEESLKLARIAAERGIDIASFKGYNQADTVSAIVSALTGETERLKSLGIVVSQSSENFRKLTAHIQETTGATETQAKTQAILQTILEQSKNAEGDYLKEGSTISQQQMDIAEATKKATAAFGEFFARGVSPVLNGYNDLLNSFSSADKEMQNLIIRTIMLNGAFAMMLKLNMFAKINASVKAISSLTTIMASAKKAAIALNAALGPIGWSAMLLSGAYLALSYVVDRNNQKRQQAIELATQERQAIDELIAKNKEQYTTNGNNLTRLEELSKYERLSNSEKTEAYDLINDLKGQYKDLEISIDSITGKINIEAGAWDKLSKTRRQQMITEQKMSFDKNKDELIARISALRGFWGTVFGTDWDDKLQNAQISFSIDGDMQKSLDEYTKIHNYALKKDYKEAAAEIQEVIDLLAKQVVIEKNLKELKSGGTVPKPNNNTIKQQSEEERKLINQLNNSDWQHKFNLSNTTEQLEIIDKKIQDIFSLQSGKYATVADFINADRYSMTEQELKDLQTIIELERKRAEIRRRSAEVFDDLVLDYDNFLNDRANKHAEYELEKQIKKIQAEGKSATAIFQSQLNKAQNKANGIQTLYLRALENAKLDGILTEAEKHTISDIRSQLSEAFSDIDKWQSRLDNETKNEDKRQEDSQKTVGAFSAQVLKMQLGGANKPWIETARNTREMVRQQRTTNEQLTKTMTYA